MIHALAVSVHYAKTATLSRKIRAITVQMNALNAQAAVSVMTVSPVNKVQHVSLIVHLVVTMVYAARMDFVRKVARKVIEFLGESVKVVHITVKGVPLWKNVHSVKPDSGVCYASTNVWGAMQLAADKPRIAYMVV